MTARFDWPDAAPFGFALSFDVDAESVLLERDPSLARVPAAMAHQQYGPRVGVPRILATLRALDVRATFFVPGVTAIRNPDTVRAIVADGHEIGHHGHLHRKPLGLDEAGERDELRRGFAALEASGAPRPLGYRAPAWAPSERTFALVAEHGLRYSSSGYMDDDVPWIAATPHGPVVELPTHWSLDDWEHFAYLPSTPVGSGVIANPRSVLQLWTAECEAMAEQGCLFLLTCHPFLIGRPSRMAAVAELVGRARALGAYVATCGEIADRAHATIPRTAWRVPDLPDAAALGY